MYMLDSDQEPSYNLSKNLLLLPRILKLIEDMVDDSTPLLYPPRFIMGQVSTMITRYASHINDLNEFYLYNFISRIPLLVNLTPKPEDNFCNRI